MAQSRAKPLARFHYRLVAAEHANRAADLLPARSQTSAAILCEATRWLIDRQPEAASLIYRRYLREGPFVPWGSSFGRQCPQPDFEKVTRERNAEFFERSGRVALWMTPILLAFTALVVLRRRRSKRAPAG